MRVLLTRPAEDAARTAEVIAARGVGVLQAPVIEIRRRSVAGDEVRAALDGVRAVLATSANGVRALADATGRRDLAVLAVGPASAAEAREAGFADVSAAEGDVHALAALVRARLRPGEGPLLHVAGTHRAGDLAAMLGRDGYAVRRLVLYEAVPASALAPDAQAALRNGEVDAVALFSPRSARLFETLLAQAGLAGLAAALDALCLSPAVAEALRLSWRSRRVAEHPEVEALAALVP